MYIFSCCLLLMGGLSPGSLATRLNAILMSPHLQDGFWGITVYAPMRGRFLYERNEAQLFRTASNMKILTNLLVFDHLGPDYRFETRLGYTGDIMDGVLKGDLVLVGGGDPSISGRDDHLPLGELLDPLISMIRNAGVKRIDGNLVGLLNFFDDRTIQDSWEWDDVGRNYCVPVSPLMLNDGLTRLDFMADRDDSLQLSHHPSGQYGVQFQHQLSYLRGELDLDISRDWGGNGFLVRGNLPLCMDVSVSFGVWDPAMQFLAVFREYLREAGIELSGTCQLSRQPQPLQYLGTLQSEPVAFLAQTFMKDSRNHYGEMFLKTVGKVVAGDGSFEGGIGVADQFLRGLDPSFATALAMFDGSGLSARNHLSPLQLTVLLDYGLKQSYAPQWLASFPIMGRDGTLSNRGLRSLARERVRAKTGTIFRTKNLSGYVETLAGEPLIFSIMVNNFSCPTKQITMAQDQICNILVQLKPNRTVRRKLRLGGI